MKDKPTGALATRPLYARPPQGRLLCPFELSLVPMKQLLMIMLSRDSTYARIELQAFDDAWHGRGLRVFLFRKDRRVDVYHQSGLHEPGRISLGAGIGEDVETDFAPARFEITPTGVHVDVGFTDTAGRRISVRIDAKDGERRHPDTLLAPIGREVEQPSVLFLAYMRGFHFVRRAGTSLQVQIDGEPQTVASLPLPIDLHCVYRAFYSTHPIIAFLNRNHEGPLRALTATAPGEHLAGENTYTLTERDGHLELSAILARNGSDTTRLTFSPAFPDIEGLQPGTGFRVSWSLSIDQDAAIIEGAVWGGRRDDSHVDLELEVTSGWRARGLKPSLWLLTRLLRWFRTWPTTYRWTATLDLEEPPTQTSRWMRTEQPSREGRRVASKPLADRPLAPMGSHASGLEGK